MFEPVQQFSEEQKISLRERQSELIKIIEAFATLSKTKEWKVIKELVFDKSLEAIERQVKNESLMPTVDVNKLYRLQGEWVWAKQYSDVDRFVETLKKQLENIKIKLQ